MTFLNLAKLKKEGALMSYDDIISDIDAVLAKPSKHTPKYVLRLLEAARLELLEKKQ